MTDEAELQRLRQIEQLLRELFVLERDMSGQLPRSISIEDERDTAEIERELKALLGMSVSTEPELQHQCGCPHPLKPCNCRRSHLLAEARRLAAMIPPTTS